MHIDTIITDMDDTLLNQDTKLSPYTLEIVQEATAKGIRFIAASGRAASSMRPFVDQLATGQPYIACNGAQIMNPDHSEIATNNLTIQQAHDLLRYFQSKGFYSQVYRGDYFYYAEPCKASMDYSAQTGMIGKEVGDLLKFVDFETPKVLSISDPAEVEKLFPIIQADFPDLSFTISKPHYLEAQPKGITKGSGIEKLSKILGFSAKNTMVFGDSLNDVSMYEFTENSVAMLNARPEVKAAANYITEFTNAQDGLAHFVKTHVLS